MSLPRAGFPLLVGFLGLVLMSCGGGSGGGGTPPPEPPVNHAPVAPDQHLDLGWGAFVALAPGASDEDGDAISYTADSATNGWLGPDFTYQAPWQNGDFVATYRCDDGRGGISIGRFLISVRRANQPPTVDDIAVVTGEGVPVAIDLDAADGDGDALGYAPGAAAHGTVTLAPDGTTIVYAPAAGYIGSDSFAVVVSDGYGGSATADVDVLVEAGASSSFHEAWRLAFLGRQPGANGAIVDDVDGDGAQELLLAGGGMWSVLRATSRTNYERVHSREFPTVASPWYGRYAPGVVAFAVAHPAGRAAGFVAAARTDRVLEITDGSDWSLVRELPLAGDAVRLVVADADNDGDDDFVVLTTGHVLLYDATTFAAAGSFALPVAGTSDLAVGDVDGDHGLEIVLSSGHVVRFDGATVAPVWTYYQNFGYTLQLGDVSGDGIDDILASHAWYRISCYDVTTRTRPWEISVFGDIGSFALADVAGDARPEVLWGDGQGWEVHGVDVRTRLEVWAIQPGSGGIAGIAVGDLDGDGHPEVATASRGNSAGPGSVVVSDAVTQQSEWTNPMIYGATVAVAVGDVDDDGVDELVVLALGGTVPWYYGGSLSVFDHATGALRWRAPAAGIGNVSPNGLAIGDADGDGDSDIVVGGGSSPACLLVFSGATGALLHDWWPALHPIQRVVILPGTGSQRVLVRTSTGLARMDGATGAVLWQSPLIIAAGVPNLVAGDVTGDGICDAVTTGDGVYLFDGATGLMHDPERVEPSETLTLADLSGDGRLDIVLGSAIGITVLDGPDRAVLRRLDRLAAYPRALSVRDVSGDGVAEIVYAGSDDAVHVIRSSTGSELWRSGFVGAALGGNNALHVDDRDGDGDVEIHVGYDNGVVRIVGALVFTNG